MSVIFPNQTSANTAHFVATWKKSKPHLKSDPMKKALAKPLLSWNVAKGGVVKFCMYYQIRIRIWFLFAQLRRCLGCSCTIYILTSLSNLSSQASKRTRC